jgi:hypothetical protein
MRNLERLVAQCAVCSASQGSCGVPVCVHSVVRRDGAIAG